MDGVTSYIRPRQQDAQNPENYPCRIGEGSRKCMRRRERVGGLIYRLALFSMSCLQVGTFCQTVLYFISFFISFSSLAFFILLLLFFLPFLVSFLPLLILFPHVCGHGEMIKGWLEKKERMEERMQGTKIKRGKKK